MPLTATQFADLIYQTLKEKGYSDAMSVTILKHLIDPDNPTHQTILQAFRNIVRQKRLTKLQELAQYPTAPAHPPYITLTAEDGTVERYALAPQQIAQEPVPQPLPIDTLGGKVSAVTAAFVEGLRETGVDIAKGIGALHTLRAELQRSTDSPIPPLHLSIDIEKTVTPEFVSNAFGSFVSAVPALVAGSFTGGASLYVIPALLGSQAMAEQLAFDEPRATVVGAVTGKKPSPFAVGVETAFSTFLFGKTVQAIEGITRPAVTRILANIAPDKRSFARAVAHFGIGAIAAGTYGTAETTLISGLHGEIPSGRRLAEVFLNYALIDMFNRAYGTFTHHQTPLQRELWKRQIAELDDIITTMQSWRTATPEADQAQDVLARILKYPIEQDRRILIQLFRRRIPHLSDEQFNTWVNKIKGLDIQAIKQQAEKIKQEATGTATEQEEPQTPPIETPPEETGKDIFEETITETTAPPPTPFEIPQTPADIFEATLETITQHKQPVIKKYTLPPEVEKAEPVDRYTELRQQIFGGELHPTPIKSSAGTETTIPLVTQHIAAATTSEKYLFRYMGRKENLYKVNPQVPTAVAKWIIDAINIGSRTLRYKPLNAKPSIVSAFGGSGGDIILYSQAIRRAYGNIPIKMLYNDLNPTLAVFMSSIKSNIEETGKLIDDTIGFVNTVDPKLVREKMDIGRFEFGEHAELIRYAEQLKNGLTNLAKRVENDINSQSAAAQDIDIAAAIYVLNALFPQIIDKAKLNFKGMSRDEILADLHKHLQTAITEVSNTTTAQGLEIVRAAIKNARSTYAGAALSGQQGRQALAKVFNGSLYVYNENAVDLLKKLIDTAKKRYPGTQQLYGTLILIDPPYFNTKGYAEGEDYSRSIGPHIELVNLAYEAAKLGAIVVYHNSKIALEAEYDRRSFAEILLKAGAMVQIVSRARPQTENIEAGQEMIAFFFPPALESELQKPRQPPPPPITPPEERIPPEQPERQPPEEPKPPEPPQEEPTPQIAQVIAETESKPENLETEPPVERTTEPQPEPEEPPQEPPQPIVPTTEEPPAVEPIKVINLPKFPDTPSVEAYASYIKESARLIADNITEILPRVMMFKATEEARMIYAPVYEEFTENIATAIANLPENQRARLYEEIADSIVVAQESLNAIGLNIAPFYLGELKTAIASLSSLIESTRKLLDEFTQEDASTLASLTAQLDAIVRGIRPLQTIASAFKETKEDAIHLQDLVDKYYILKADIRRYHRIYAQPESITPANPPSVNVDALPKEQVMVATGENKDGTPTVYDAIRLAVPLEDIIISHYFDQDSLAKARQIFADWLEQYKLKKDIPPPSLEGVTLHKTPDYPLIQAREREKEIDLASIRDIVLTYAKDPSLVHKTLLSNEAWLATGTPVVFWDAERQAFVTLNNGRLLALQMLPDNIREQVFAEIRKHIQENNISQHDIEPDTKERVVTRVLLNLSPSTLRVLSAASNFTPVTIMSERELAYTVANLRGIPALYNFLESTEPTYLNAKANAPIRLAIMKALASQQGNPAAMFFSESSDQLNPAGIRFVQNLLIAQVFQPFAELNDIVEIAFDPSAPQTIRKFLLNLAIPVAKIQRLAEQQDPKYNITPDIVAALRHIGQGLRTGMTLQLAVRTPHMFTTYSTITSTLLDILSVFVNTPTEFETVLSKLLDKYLELVPELSVPRESLMGRIDPYPPEKILKVAARSLSLDEVVGVKKVDIQPQTTKRKTQPQQAEPPAAPPAPSASTPSEPEPTKETLIEKTVRKAKAEIQTDPPITEHEFIQKGKHHTRIVGQLKHAGFSPAEIAIVEELLRNIPDEKLANLTITGTDKIDALAEYHYGSKEIKIKLSDSHLKFLSFLHEIFHFAWDTILTEQDKKQIIDIIKGKGLTGKALSTHQKQVREFARFIGVTESLVKRVDERLAEELGASMFQAWVLTGLPVTKQTETVFNKLRVDTLHAISRLLAANYTTLGFDKDGNPITPTELTEIFRKIAYAPGAPVAGNEQQLPTGSLLGAIRKVASKGIIILTIDGQSPVTLGIPEGGGKPVLFPNKEAAQKANFKGTIVGEFKPGVHFFRITESITSKPLTPEDLKALGVQDEAEVILRHYASQLAAEPSASIITPETTKPAETDLPRIFLELRDNISRSVKEIGNGAMRIVEKPIYYRINKRGQPTITTPKDPEALVFTGKVLIIEDEAIARNLKTLVEALTSKDAQAIAKDKEKAARLQKIADTLKQAGLEIDLNSLLRLAKRNDTEAIKRKFVDAGLSIVETINERPVILIPPTAQPMALAEFIEGLKSIEREGKTLIIGSKPYEVVKVTTQEITLSRQGKTKTTPLEKIKFKPEEAGQLLKVWEQPTGIQATIVTPEGTIETVDIEQLITEANLQKVAQLKATPEPDAWQNAGPVQKPQTKPRKKALASPIFPWLPRPEVTPTTEPTDPVEVVAQTWDIPPAIIRQAKKSLGWETQPFETLTAKQWQSLYALATTLQSIPEPARFRGFLGGVARFLLGDRLTGAPMEFLRQAPKLGPQVADLITKIENFARDIIGRNTYKWEEAWHSLSPKEQIEVWRFIQSGEFYRYYRKGMRMPTPALQKIADAIKEIFDDYYNTEKEVGVMERDPLTNKWQPIRYIKNYIPIHLTSEAIGVLAAANIHDPRWHALRALFKASGVSFNWLNRRLINQQRPFGNIEVARIVDLAKAIENYNAKMMEINPNYGKPKEGQIMVNGKPFQIIVTDITQLIPFYIGRAAMRVSIIKHMGQGSPRNPQKISPQRIFEGLMQEDRSAAFAWKFIWDNLNHYRLTSEEWSIVRPLNEFLDGIRGIQLSMAWLWQPTGYIPIAEVFGLKNTIKAFYQTFTPQGQDLLQKLRLRNVWSRDVIPYTSFATFSMTGAGARFSRALLALTPLNAVNRHINKTIALATAGWMREIAGKPLSTEDKALLKELADFNDAQIKEVENGNLTDDLIAQAARRAVARLNGFQESAADIAPLYRHPFTRSILAYTQWTRLMGRLMAQAVLQAQKGNYRPLARAIFGTAASAVLISALREAAFGKKEDQTFWGEVFYALMDIQRFGLFADWIGDAIFGLSRNENPAEDLLDIPQLSGFGNLILGVYKALKGKGEQALVKSIPAFRAIEHLTAEEEDEEVEYTAEVE